MSRFIALFFLIFTTANAHTSQIPYDLLEQNYFNATQVPTLKDFRGRKCVAINSKRPNQIEKITLFYQDRGPLLSSVAFFRNIQARNLVSADAFIISKTAQHQSSIHYEVNAKMQGDLIFFKYTWITSERGVGYCWKK